MINYQEGWELDKIRACELRVGDEFIFHLIWRKVDRIKDGRIYFFSSSSNYEDSLGAKSQMFVRVKKGPNWP